MRFAVASLFVFALAVNAFAIPATSDDLLEKRGRSECPVGTISVEILKNTLAGIGKNQNNNIGNSGSSKNVNKGNTNGDTTINSHSHLMARASGRGTQPCISVEAANNLLAGAGKNQNNNIANSGHSENTNKDNDNGDLTTNSRERRAPKAAKQECPAGTISVALLKNTIAGVGKNQNNNVGNSGGSKNVNKGNKNGDTTINGGSGGYLVSRSTEHRGYPPCISLSAAGNTVAGIGKNQNNNVGNSGHSENTNKDNDNGDFESNA